MSKPLKYLYKEREKDSETLEDFGLLFKRSRLVDPR